MKYRTLCLFPHCNKMKGLPPESLYSTGFTVTLKSQSQEAKKLNLSPKLTEIVF